jgi:hypothetical protein
MKLIVHKIRFFFKKLSMQETTYNLMKWESDHYNNMLQCIKGSLETECVKAKQGNHIVAAFPKSQTLYITINITELLKAGGYEFNGPVKYDIKY